MSDEARLLARNSMRPHPTLGTGYTDRASAALFGEPEAVSLDVQEELTERSYRAAQDLLAVEWGKASSRIVSALDHFTQVARPSDHLRSRLRAVTRQVERIDQEMAR